MKKKQHFIFMILILTGHSIAGDDLTFHPSFTYGISMISNTDFLKRGHHFEIALNYPISKPVDFYFAYGYNFFDVDDSLYNKYYQIYPRESIPRGGFVSTKTYTGNFKFKIADEQQKGNICFKAGLGVLQYSENNLLIPDQRESSLYLNFAIGYQTFFKKYAFIFDINFGNGFLSIQKYMILNARIGFIFK